MDYVGHMKQDTGEIQLLKDHLTNVADMSSEFIMQINKDYVTEMYKIGLYHDAGKYSKEFQEYIRGLLNKRVDHSTAGAQLMLSAGDLLAAECIAGHHCGLPNKGSRTDTEHDSTLIGRSKKQIPEYICAFAVENGIPPSSKPRIKMIASNRDEGAILSNLYIRMFYSCLVDADFLDTENFMTSGFVERGGYKNIEELHALLCKHIKKHLSNPNSEINRMRCSILQRCIGMGIDNSRGLFSLTVPTGAGKTISSLAFALNHAKQHGLRRVIYVIPYTSIIEQNAQVFSSILGEDNVLEHHMNVDYDDEEECFSKKKLATENWDAPVIVTTNVQFFESLFHNRSSKCRKLHNIANSVIIFDEVQMLPLEYMKACSYAIKSLVSSFNCSVLLCSATQPAVDRNIKDIDILEICEDVDSTFEFFRRNRVMIVDRKISTQELAGIVDLNYQALCIVNTKKTAQAVAAGLKKDAYHLSTNMYPAHRRRILAEIKEKLKNNERCIVVSTNLIEAGVDVDFPIVYREMTGIDSIVQSAGRCNREGKRGADDCHVIVFELDDAGKDTDFNLRRISCTKETLNNYDDVTTTGAVREYFEHLYYLSDSLMDKNHILQESADMALKTVAEKFKLIEDDTTPIMIHVEGENDELVDQLTKGCCNRKLMRRVGQYVVNVYNYRLLEYLQQGCLHPTESGVYILIDNNMYDEKVGLSHP